MKNPICYVREVPPIDMEKCDHCLNYFPSDQIKEDAGGADLCTECTEFFFDQMCDDEHREFWGDYEREQENEN